MDIKEKNKQILSDYIKEILEPEKSDTLSFLTLRFPINNPAKDIDIAKERMRKVLRGIHSKLQGKGWNKKPYKSVTIVEHGKMGVLHAHTLINTKNKSFQDMIDTVKYVAERGSTLNLCWGIKIGKDIIRYGLGFNPMKNDLVIEEVYSDGAITYIIKEYKLENVRSINWDNFIPYTILLYQ
jgi:hypothetical protein